MAQRVCSAPSYEVSSHCAWANSRSAPFSSATCQKHSDSSSPPVCLCQSAIGSRGNGCVGRCRMEKVGSPAKRTRSCAAPASSCSPKYQHFRRHAPMETAYQPRAFTASRTGGASVSWPATIAVPDSGALR